MAFIKSTPTHRTGGWSSRWVDVVTSGGIQFIFPMAHTGWWKNFAWSGENRHSGIKTHPACPAEVDPDTLQLRELEYGVREEREKRFTQFAGMFTSPPGTSWEKRANKSARSPIHVRTDYVIWHAAYKTTPLTISQRL
jgi:hypothetical protein